ncbi:Stp1/IreP family PP2C-type Ser/Thr phosphatase [Cellulomonas denverensis]|uniref:Serine/threonine protein phosphatase PstP n=1 Tax=Cellulomonas denverensis TaxID=264297 RepID=A0A7X6KY23_9CELL|nr:Stp1/IreP family PP2C-type Ser/Thr phosphatase [Cellulomonas denverensis]NKY24271.1 Stp1/IreP family PP2C-type Ser/Thr phosphatase [Cellulomonas denverensis]GIG26748.1 serine/threonine protein phosphatase [Cellulomonas denverensis]
MSIALRYAARSDVGLVRSNNQDSAYAGPHLLVVADGMGGHAGGDVASSVAIAALAPLDGESHGPDDALDELERALDSARDEIISLSQEHPELAGMGTTVTAILRSGNKLAMVHLGDSRGYLLRDGVLTQVTSDHTFVQHLVNTGKITPEEAEHHPQRSVVMRVLGDFDSDIAPDLSVREARSGDRWLLCSDGLSGFVSGDTIARTLHEIQDVDTCAERLVQLALRAGGGDNVTVVVADVVELDTLPDGAGPTTNAVVVGSAATTRNMPTAASDGPAARAAELSRQANTPTGGVPVVTPEIEDEDTDDDERRARRRRRTRGWVIALVALIVLAGAGFGFYRWTQTQFYVGESDGRVAIYQGIPQTLGPITFSDVVEVSELDLDDLPQYVQQRVEQTIHTGSLAQARERVLALAEEAGPEPSPSPSPSPSVTRSATDSTDQQTAGT